MDSSKFSAENDYKPCRFEASKACVQKFILEYYDQNPISQLGMIATRDRSAERLTELSGNAKNHIHVIKSVRNMSGLASLQNTILLAMSMLRHIPNYGHRELLIVFSSLSTCDPGDIFDTIRDAKAQKIRISVVCLVAEVFVCRQVAELTGGSFAVAIDATHLSELLQQHTVPPPEVQRSEALVTDFIYMGFPKRAFDSTAAYGFDGKKMRLSGSAYICPRCSTRTTDIPTQCCVCHLQLNSSSHIARSHHHLFPVSNYLEYEVKESIDADETVPATSTSITTNSEKLTLTLKKPTGGIAVRKAEVRRTFTAVCVDATALAATTTAAADGNPSDAGVCGVSAEDREVALQEQVGNSRCRGCLEPLCRACRVLMRCPQCRNFFCVECDLFVHDSLHNCPGCL